MCFLFSGGYYTAGSKGNILLTALIRCCFIFAYTACKNAASDSRYNAPESFSHTKTTVSGLALCRESTGVCIQPEFLKRCNNEDSRKKMAEKFKIWDSSHNRRCMRTNCPDLFNRAADANRKTENSENNRLRCF